jgi:hypothetical protein
MPNFVLAYHGGTHFETKAEGTAHMNNWNNWTASLGDAIVDPGMFLGPSKTVSTSGVADDGGANPLSGITVLQADSLESVLEMAKRCPHVDIGGTIEIAQVMQM